MKPNLVKNAVLLLLSLACLSSAIAQGTGETEGFQLCDRLLRQLNVEYQKGAIGRSKADLSQTLPESYSQGDGVREWQRHSKMPPEKWFESLHEDVLSYLTNPPTQRDLEAFSEKYGMSEEQALNVLTYFASRHYFNAVRLLGEPRQVLSRLSEISRSHRLTDARNPLSRRYPFYLSEVTRLSVPEIVEVLKRTDSKVTEQQVYDELSELGISIEAEFSPYMDRAWPLLREGKSAAEVAGSVGVGKQALEFFLHYDRERQRGVPWNRVVRYEGEAYEEEKLLRKLWGKYSSHEIATRLNAASGTPPSDALYRTQASVTAKARALKLTTSVDRKGGDLEIPGYGLVKQGGILQREAIDYLYDHFDIPIADLSARLGVNPGSLREFAKRHDIVLISQRAQRVVIAPVLSEEQRAVFVDAELGLLAQVAGNLKGFSRRADVAVRAFALEQVKDSAKQAEALRRIDALGILARDGAKAHRVKKAQDRIYEALRIIAEVKGAPLERASRAEGERVFGFRRNTIPVLSESERSIFVHAESGLFQQVADNLRGFSRRTDEAIRTFAREQVKDSEKQAEALRRIEALGILASDGTTARRGAKKAQDRIHEALRIIAEAKGMPLKSASGAEGQRVFGFRVDKVPVLSESERSVFVDAESGLLPQVADNLRGFSRRADEAIRAFAREQVKDSEKQAEALRRIEALGILARDGAKAHGVKRAQDRIYEALRIIAEAKGMPLKGASDAEGERVFGFRVNRVPILSDSERSVFANPESGLLQRVADNLTGLSNKTDETIRAFVRKQVKDSTKQVEALRRIEALKILPQDGGNAQRGQRRPQDRIHEALRIIAEVKGMPLKSAFGAEGERVFGFRADRVPVLSKAERSVFVDTESGLLRQVADNLTGFSTSTAEVIRAFAREQVKDSTKQAEALRRLEALRILATDGNAAQRGQKKAQNRIHEALRIIAEAKGTPLKRGSSAEGGKAFGFRVETTPVLSEAERVVFLDAESGLLAQVANNLTGFSRRTDKTIRAFAREQVKDSAKQAQALRRIDALKISPGDGGNAQQGVKKAQDRIHEALRIIAEMKSTPLTRFDRSNGSRVFNFK